MPQRTSLLKILADGRFHSGEELGRALGVSRTAIWKAIRACSDLGVEVHAVPGRGYRLAEPLELLEPAAICASLAERTRPLLSGLEVLADVDSTNRYLLDAAASRPGRGRVCLAERQRAGRGRRGRHWTSPFAANIYLSVLWRFGVGPAALAGLSLAIGVAAVRALECAGAQAVGLKWPNDLVWQGRKLGGILLEMSGESAGPSRVIVGVGINVCMPPAAATEIDQPWVDLATAMSGRKPSRNVVAALLVQELLAALDEFERSGFAPFRGDWERYDLVAGREVELHLPEGIVRGRATGIDGTGALLLLKDGRIRSYSSGEVGLRLRP
jgi:BirA family transcriptional regulator, biotin operon repressor / biotin---[acetyl-CoA-carboxylase] ligase